MQHQSPFRILCVGVATLDIVNRVTAYPAEDSEVRALGQSRRLGGNAANTAVVLGQLGADVQWTGSLPADSGVVEREFARFGVPFSSAVRVSGGSIPTSYITLSEANGSRSIVHYRDLPEYQAADFLQLDMELFDWIHFEGRAVTELTVMLDHVAGRDDLKASVEIEKPRPDIETLFAHADLLLFSRAYALARGFDSAEVLLRSLPAETLATCTWGGEGAWAVDRNGELWAQAPPSGIDVVDTIGAGDVFNAAMVNAIGRGLAVPDALRIAVDLASRQCATDGLTLTL